MKWSLFALLIGFGIDLIVGDPHGLPHPVVGIGKLISLLERRFRALFPRTARGEIFAGACIWLCTVLVSAGLPALILYGAQRVSVYLRLALESVMCWQVLAVRSLREESMRVYAALQTGSLSAAQQAVSMIVGRDTARLSALFLLAAGAILGLDAKNGWRIFRRDRYRHASPNSAQTESVCAGLLGLRLAGDAWYHGVLHKKPYIGDERRAIEPDDIPRACRLMTAAAILALLACAGVKALCIFLCNR